MTGRMTQGRVDRAIGRLVREVAALRRTQEAAARSQPLRNAAIDGGRGITVRDAAGEVTQQVGPSAAPVATQAPPQPSAPLVTPGAAAVQVALDGLDVDGNGSPADLRHTEVHMSLEEGFTPSLATLKGVVTDPHGTITVARPAGLWHVRVVWVTLSGQRSAPSDPAAVDIEPLVDTADIEQVLATARAELAAATAEADAQFAELGRVTAESQAALDAATERLAAAEATLAPLPGDVTAAQEAAEAAADAALAAEARATEANNRAMTRLANGNFEDGLKYWAGTATLITDSHSGGNAVEVGGPSAKSIHPESFMPVVAGQIWELQFYYKALNAEAQNGSIVGVFRKQDSTTVGTWLIRPAVAEGAWGAASLRLTVPEGVDAVRPSIGRLGGEANALWAVDDVVMRDVTDVVRLEQAAQAAKKAGDDAMAQARTLELAMGGLETRLSTAEGNITAVGQKATEDLSALDTALRDAFADADAAVQSAAATDATDKANAARTAAEAEALRLAQAEAAAAQSAAEATAAADALAKANAARDAAISSAAGDATTKADAAREAAKTAAAADAKAKADAAQAAAISAAATDAKAKADAAQAEALRLAKLDATAKADAAKDAAVQTAASDAQTKFDAAKKAADDAMKEARSKASPEYILSRGTDLVTNGTGFLGNNTNFSGFTFDPTDAPTGARGSFDSRLGVMSTGFSDEYMAIDASKKYLARVMVKQKGVSTSAVFHVRVYFYTAWGHQIGRHNVLQKGVTATLTAPLKPGDTTISVDTTKDWASISLSTYSRYIGVWGWTDPNGKTWPEGTFTQHHIGSHGAYTALTDTSVTLANPYSGPVLPAGTKIANMLGGDAMTVILAGGLRAPAEWTSYSAIVDKSNIPPATATTRLNLLSNYGTPEGSQTSFANVSFSDATAALADAQAAQGVADAAKAAADAAQSRADAAHTAAGSAQSSADAAMTRAGAAETNAKAEAKRLADAAESAAKTAAAADATAKANAAETAAKSAAAADAKTKADAAKAAAEAAAKTYADAVAAGAEADAIAAAAADAKAKADAAEAAAKAAAASDAQAKAAAAQAAAIAAAAADATTKANNAKAAAEAAAKTYSDGLPKVLHGTAAPSGTAPDGSVWFQHAGSLSGAVTAQWNRVGGQWVSTPIRSEAIANLDVGKLTAGSATVGETVTQKLLANEAIINRLTSAAAWIGGTIIKDGEITAPKITVTDDLITKFFAANRALINEELVVRGNLIANHATIISAALKNLSVTEKATFAQAFADDFWAKMAVIDRLTAQSAWIGGAMLEDGAVTAEKITATESLTAKVAQFLKVKAGMIEANAFEGQAFTGGTFTGAMHQTEAAAQRGVKMDPQGFRSYAPDGTQTFNVDSATGQVTANGMDVRGGAVTGATITGGYVGTANMGRRVYMQGDTLTAKNDQEQVTGYFSPEGMGLTRPGTQEVSAIGPHIFGTNVITASTDTNTDIPNPPDSGNWGEWRTATPSTVFPVVSRRYALDYGFTIRPNLILANANARLQFRVDITDENGVVQGNLLSRFFHMQDVTNRAPHNFYLSTMANIPSSMPNGSTARLSYGFRIRGIDGGFFSDVNMKMTPS